MLTSKTKSTSTSRPKSAHQSGRSQSSTRATRNATLKSPESPLSSAVRTRKGPRTIAVETAEEIEAANSAPVPALIRIPRRSIPASTPSQRRAAQNLLSALGGPDPVVETLRLSSKSKALQLADLMQDTAHKDISFHLKLSQVGLNVVEFTDLLLEMKHATIIARLAMSGPEVAESILSRATDQFRPHNACLQSGRVLDEETGALTEFECFGCQGTGWLLESAEREWVELYLELIRLRKVGPVVDNSRKVTNQNLNLFGDLASGDGAPSIDSIIKRADQQQLQLPAADGKIPFVPGMPEDSVNDSRDSRDSQVAIEAEIVV